MDLSIFGVIQVRQDGLRVEVGQDSEMKTSRDDWLLLKGGGFVFVQLGPSACMPVVDYKGRVQGGKEKG